MEETVTISLRAYEKLKKERDKFEKQIDDFANDGYKFSKECSTLTIINESKNRSLFSPYVELLIGKVADEKRDAILKEVIDENNRLKSRKWYHLLFKIGG